MCQPWIFVQGRFTERCPLFRGEITNDSFGLALRSGISQDNTASRKKRQSRRNDSGAFVSAVTAKNFLI